MQRADLHTASWRALPRTGPCAVAELVGGDCRGPRHLHHVTPLSLGGDPDGKVVTVCAAHHPMLEALARRVHHTPRCPHQHRTPEARAICERRLLRAS